jgi:hypothetical protein
MPERHNELAVEAMTTTPQLDSEGYALYVKLWDLRAEAGTNEREYQKVIRLLTDAREAGLFD